MNAQQNMKKRRSRLIVATLLVGIVGGLVFGGPSALAQPATAQTTSTTQATTVDSSLQIPVSGTVSDPAGTISVSGYVIVNCTRVIDTTLGALPLVLLTFDFSKMRGTSGNSLATLKVYVTGGNATEQVRPLQTSDVVAIPCPYYDSTKDLLSASSWLVTTTLNFDVSTGKLTSGTATVGAKPAAF